MKNFLKNISFSILIIVVFFGGLEFAQRVRYYFKEESKYYLTYGFETKANVLQEKSRAPGSAGATSKINPIDTYAEIPFVRLDGYAKCVPGTYGREYKGKTFPVHINKLGLRGKEVSPEKEEGVFRIVIMGGSSVQGLESPDNATIASYLQALTGEGNVEVINAGIIGHTAGSVSAMLDKEILKINPDMVILYLAFNDCRHAGIFEAAGTFGKNPVRRFLGKTWAWLYNHSFLFATIYEKFTVFREKAVSFKSAEETFRQYRDNINKTIENAQKNGIRVVIVKQPLYIEGLPALQDGKLADAIERKVKNGEKITFEEAY